MIYVDPTETKLMEELVKELNEFNSYIRNGSIPYGRDLVKGNIFFAFNPELKRDRDFYRSNMELIKDINFFLDENCFSVKYHGFSFIRDSLCIVADYESLDICLTKDVYPYIAKKYENMNVSKVEHCIRNAISNAYDTVKTKYPDRDCLMNSFDEKPTTKKFLLRAVQEIESRLFEEMYH